MTKIDTWMCDICKQTFHNNNAGYGANVGFQINIPSGFSLEGETEFKFVDTCLDCRVKLIIAIEKLIKE
jgi:hypothetical protein